MTIPSEKETSELLRSQGGKGETYDQLIKRLISLTRDDRTIATINPGTR